LGVGYQINRNLALVRMQIIILENWKYKLWIY
jgi:hypothetical protein